MKQFLSRITDSILLNPIRSCSILVVLLLLSFWQASKLTVNSNNLEPVSKLSIKEIENNNRACEIKRCKIIFRFCFP
ncbi:hypothetical protein, partial [Leptospira kirschneri]|uniref:hypothetical protein n=1 Tax=Leptospira kirschneri TaxID=29507 RepID=UPI001C4E1E35